MLRSEQPMSQKDLSWRGPLQTMNYPLSHQNAHLSRLINQAKDSLILGHNTNIPKNHRKTSSPTVLGPQVWPQELLQPTKLTPTRKLARHIIYMRSLEDLATIVNLPINKRSLYCQKRSLFYNYARHQSHIAIRESPNPIGMPRYLTIILKLTKVQAEGIQVGGSSRPTNQ